MRVTEDWLRAYEAKHRGKHAPTLKPSKAVDLESELHDSIIEYCLSKGWLYAHARMDKPNTITPGTPDFLIWGDGGRFWLVECKARNEKLEPAQVDFKAHAEKMGFRVHVVRNLEQFLEVVQ